MRAVVFDLDDTLYPEQAFVVSGFRAVADWAKDHLHIPAERALAELHRLFEGGVRGNTFDHWLEERGINPDGLVPQMVQVYRGHHPRIDPYPEVPALLQRLGRRYRLGLVSDGHLAVQKRKLAALDLAPYFDAVVFSDEWGRDAWKPSTKPFEAVLARLNLQGAETVYVADNPSKDFLGARQMGIQTVRIRRPDGLYTHLEPPTPEHAPDAEIMTLEDLDQQLASE